MAKNTSELHEAAAGVIPRFILVGQDLSTYLNERFGVAISEKTVRGRYMREPALQVVYFFGKAYTTPQWADEWFFARLRDQPAHGRSNPRPPLAAKLRDQFRAEEAEILASIQTAELSDRERAGNVWNDAPA